jgi:hypothetical protein
MQDNYKATKGISSLPLFSIEYSAPSYLMSNSNDECDLLMEEKTKADDDTDDHEYVFL